MRQRLLAARASLSVTQQQAASAAIIHYLRTSLEHGLISRVLATLPHRPVIAAYWPIRNEPDLRPLLTAWAGTCCDIALPRVVQRDAPLAFHRWLPGTPMTPGAFGIPEPAGHTSVTPDVLFVPTLGYTDQAERLGYGGGYYDRTLAQLDASGAPYTAIGIAFSIGRLTQQEHQPASHDMPLDAIVTDTGWVPSSLA